MHGILRPRQTHARLSDPEVAADLQALTLDFLKQVRQSALGRFDGHRILPSGCHTVQRRVPEQPGGLACTGTIVAHVSAPVFNTWAAAAPGTVTRRRAHVLQQLQLVLQDLSDHDMHGYLALTDTQCEVYDQDLVQLVRQSLDRTTFSSLNRDPDVHWEGTLVRSLQPPALVLVVSIGFHDAQAPQ